MRLRHKEHCRPAASGPCLASSRKARRHAVVGAPCFTATPMTAMSLLSRERVAPRRRWRRQRRRHHQLRGGAPRAASAAQGRAQRPGPSTSHRAAAATTTATMMMMTRMSRWAMCVWVGGHAGARHGAHAWEGRASCGCHSNSGSCTAGACQPAVALIAISATGEVRLRATTCIPVAVQ